jgi:torulene dioxygenase
VLDAVEKRSYLVVLDAKNMEEIARAEMANVFPIGFHGIWSPNKSDSLPPSLH